MENKELTDLIINFFRTANVPALFAGAGVSAQADCRTWSPMLSTLADRVEPRDTHTAALMRKHIGSNRLDLAADIYLQCTDLTKQEALAWIADAIGTPNSAKIRPLICLPFKFALTTNYERALNDAYAFVHGTSPLDTHTFDPFLRNAAFATNPYIARIHGRMEVPESMVLATWHYANLIQQEHASFYKSFLFYALTRAQLMFVGFSFVDPGIANVFRAIKSEYPSNLGIPHLALLSADASGELHDLLRSVNIRVHRYGSREELWDSFAVACRYFKEPANAPSPKPSPMDEAFGFAKRYMASCYARTRLGPRMAPLTNAVVEGFVANSLRTATSTETQVAEQLSMALKIPVTAAHSNVSMALTELSKERLCDWQPGKPDQPIVWKGSATDGLNTDIEFLAQQIGSRFSLRSGHKLPDAHTSFVSNFLKFVIVRRGWDLGASYAAGRVPPAVNVLEMMKMVSGWDAVERGGQSKYLRDSIEDLLLHPEVEEASILADLGRVSFACEIVFRSPRDSLLHKLVLPQKVYLDANVLMPALAEGHPYQLLYQKAIERLIDATERSQAGIKIEVLWGFLNEVISHRRNALTEVTQMGPDYVKYIESDASLYGVGKLNAFIGAYVNFRKLSDKKISFEQYLAKYAPYRTEEELAKWLGGRGISVVGRTDALLPQTDKGPLLHLLEVAFEEQIRIGARTNLLVNHDATQLAVLLADTMNSIRSIFVTADQRLRRAVENSAYSALTGAMVSHVGLAQLIDLLVGMKPEQSGYTQLMWFARGSSDTDNLRQHLTWLALNEYDAAMTLGMNRIIDDYAEDIIADLEKEGMVGLDADTSDKEHLVRRVLGMYEDKFMENMKAEADKIRRRLEEPDEPSPSQ